MGHIARRMTEEHVKAVKDRIDLLSKVVPSPGTPMYETAYLVGHTVHGWNATIKDVYFKEHGCYPTGASALTTRNAYCTDWMANKAPDDVRAAFKKDYADYRVCTPSTISSPSLTTCRRTSVSNAR
jgi:hypothetical protein